MLKSTSRVHLYILLLSSIIFLQYLYRWLDTGSGSCNPCTCLRSWCCCHSSVRPWRHRLGSDWCQTTVDRSPSHTRRHWSHPPDRTPSSPRGSCSQLHRPVQGTACWSMGTRSSCFGMALWGWSLGWVLIGWAGQMHLLWLKKIMLLYFWTSHLLLIKIHKFSLAN